jgi:hypothetical protein
MKSRTRRPICALLIAVGLTLALEPRSARAGACDQRASDACFFAFHPGAGEGAMHYYASRAPSAAGPARALIVMHGHPRDANRTFEAGLAAVRNAAALDGVLVFAPLFQVDAEAAGDCETEGVPAAAPGDLTWTCQSWMDGGVSTHLERVSSFAAMDALLREIQSRWPSVTRATLAGFSAGAQFVQHYAGFADPPPLELRYVVADPGTFLYFDPVRPSPEVAGAAVDWTTCAGGAMGLGACELAFAVPGGVCGNADHWKYGLSRLPAHLGRDATAARAAYAAADISYLEGGQDFGEGRGTAYSVLDRSCAAEAQGPFRLQRGLAYVQYDRAMLAKDRPRPLAVVPGCAHDVACVFPSAAARELLLGR